MTFINNLLRTIIRVNVILPLLTAKKFDSNFYIYLPDT
jgi:hypothetical protein